MNKLIVIAILIVLLLIGAGVFYIYPNKGLKQRGGEEKVTVTAQPTEPELIKATETNMIISSSVFDNNGTILKKYTCDSNNVNPPLTFSDIPEEAKSLVLIVDDVDAPSKVWNHWLVWNISPNVYEIEEDTVPQGAVQGKNDFGNNNYGGPCPPSGIHRYRFKLFALDTELDLDKSSTQKDVEEAIDKHILDKAILIGTYGR